MKVSYLESIKKICPSIQAPSSFPPHLKNVNMEKKNSQISKKGQKANWLISPGNCPLMASSN